VAPALFLTAAGHDVDTVIDEGLTGTADPDVVTAATADGRISSHSAAPRHGSLGRLPGRS
jgi:hypothetical protein